MDLPLLKELVIIFSLSVFVIYGCSRVKIPPIVGFLVTGMVCGPYGLGLVSAVHEVEILAEIGVVMLMFSIGMELSISELARLRKPVFLGGSLQVGLTILTVAAIAALFAHARPGQALCVGCLAALSSTAIVLKLLQQSGQVESPHGRITLSILIFQDLVIVPMMLAVPLMAGVSSLNGTDSPLAMLLAGAKTLGIISAVFLLARKLVPVGLAMVVRTRSRELFLIATLGICLSIAWITSMLGLSLSLGAFMAGLIMSESEYSHSALEGVLPFRDVFTSLFFTSVGMLLNLTFFVHNIGQIALMICLLLSLKALVATVTTMILGYPLRPAIITGLALCQIGEFSFVLAKVGLDAKLVSPDGYQLFLAASIMTMAAAPFLLTGSQRCANKICSSAFITRLLHERAKEKEDMRPEAADLSDHLIIIGFGVGGKYLARTAKMAGIAYTILEMNPDTVRIYAQKGEPISHGDATHPAVLRSLGLLRARVLAIVISDPAAVRGITETARHMAPGLHILVRTRFLGEVNALKDLGASDVIPEELETAVEIFTRVLSRYLVPRGDIEHFVNEVRSENYDMIRKLALPGVSFGALQKHMPELNVTALRIAPESSLAGRTLGESNLRGTMNMTVVAVLRGEKTLANPDGAFRLEAGDVAYVFADPDSVAEAARLFSGADEKAYRIFGAAV